MRGSRPCSLLITRAVPSNLTSAGNIAGLSTVKLKIGGLAQFVGDRYPTVDQGKYEQVKVASPAFISSLRRVHQCMDSQPVRLTVEF